VKGVADRVPVSFAGEGSGTGELSWGQQTVWRGMELGGGESTILTGVALLTGGTTVDDVGEVLRYLMGRHQSLRTRMRQDGDGHVQQMVARSGVNYLEIVDAPPDADPARFARALADSYEEWEHDCFRDWPIRMAVVRQGGVPAYRVMGICHLTSDGFGIVTLLNDLGGWDFSTGRVLGSANPDPVTAMEPLEQAEWQASPAGQRRSAIAEQYWDRLLRVIPARRFAGSGDKRSPRSANAVYDSPAAFLAIQVIAARTQTDTSPVLLAAAAVAMAKVSGINPAVPRMFVSNRFRGRLAGTVSPIAQTCPCLIDVDGITFDQAVTRAISASIAALKHAYFQPARVREIIAAVSAERGEEIDLACVYNDRRLITPREPGASLPAPASLRAALPDSTLRWENQSDEPGEPFLIHIRESPASVNILVGTDSHYISPDDVEAFLRIMEAVIVGAALDPDMPTGVQ
jgi:Condensation domain